MSKVWSGRLTIGIGEYLPAGLDETYLNEKSRALPHALDNQVEVTDFERINPQAIQISLTNHSSEQQSVVLPLLWHDMWRVQAVSPPSPSDPILANADGYTLLTVPSGYDGRLVVKFVEPWFWRVAEGVTLLSATGVLAYAISRYRRRRFGTVR